MHHIVVSEKEIKSLKTLQIVVCLLFAQIKSSGEVGYQRNCILQFIFFCTGHIFIFHKNKNKSDIISLPPAGKRYKQVKICKTFNEQVDI